MQYIAFNLTAACRESVLERFKPRFEHVFAEHVTHLYGVDRDLDVDLQMPQKPHSLLAYAYASDNIGVEALLVEVDGQRTRPDGKPYHLTLSLNEGRRQSDSNQVIEAFGSKPLTEPIELDAEPVWND